MKDLSLQRIVDVIADAFSIFDFSFIVSGGFLLTIIAGVLWRFNRLSFLNSMSIVYLIPLLILLIYVMGLMAWSIGKPIREFCLKSSSDKSFWRLPHSKRDADFEGIITSLKDFTELKKESEYKDADNKLLYSMMWTALSTADNVKFSERVSLCNRYWVMQAVFEGLVTDFIVCMIASILLLCCGKIEWTTFFFAEATSLFCFMACVNRAHYYAKSQILEIIADYIFLIKNQNVNER